MNGNILFANASAIAQDGGLHWDDPNLSFRVMLCSSAYVPRASDVFVSSVTHELTGSGYVRLGLSSRTVAYDPTNARVDSIAGSAVWSSINAGTAAWAVVYRFATNDADSVLVCAIDLRTPAHPIGIVTTGAPLQLDWGGSAPTGRVFSAFGVMRINPLVTLDRLGTLLTERDTVQELGYVYDDTVTGRTVRDPGHVDVRALGADPTGTADSYAALQSALDRAAQSGISIGDTGRVTILIPSGRYKISQPLRLELGFAVHIVGHGRQTTQLIYTGADLPDEAFLTLWNCRECWIEHLQIFANTTAQATGYGVDFQQNDAGGGAGSTRNTCVDVIVGNFPRAQQLVSYDPAQPGSTGNDQHNFWSCSWFCNIVAPTGEGECFRIGRDGQSMPNTKDIDIRSCVGFGDKYVLNNVAGGSYKWDNGYINLLTANAVAKFAQHVGSDPIHISHVNTEGNGRVIDWFGTGATNLVLETCAFGELVGRAIGSPPGPTGVPDDGTIAGAPLCYLFKFVEASGPLCIRNNDFLMLNSSLAVPGGLIDNSLSGTAATLEWHGNAVRASYGPVGSAAYPFWTTLGAGRNRILSSGSNHYARVNSGGALTYLGPVFERDDGQVPFEAANIGELFVRWDASFSADLEITAGGVSKWKNHSDASGGSTYDATDDGVASHRPSTGTDADGDYVLFDPTTLPQFLRTGAFSRTGVETWIAKVKLETDPGAGTTLIGDRTSVGRLLQFQGSTPDLFQTYAGSFATTASGTVVTGTATVVAGVFDDDDGEASVVGVTSVSADVGNNAGNGVSIGARGDSSFAFGKLKVYWILGYVGHLADSQMQLAAQGMASL